jgi:hypothetical protein
MTLNMNSPIFKGLRHLLKGQVQTSVSAQLRKFGG